MNKKIDVNIVNKDKRTALHCASSVSDNEETIRMLLDREDMEINNVDGTGKTVLHYCCIVGYGVDILETILKYKCHNNSWITGVDHQGRAALHYAKMNDHRDIYALVLSKVSDADRK